MRTLQSFTFFPNSSIPDSHPGAASYTLFAQSEVSRRQRHGLRSRLSHSPTPRNSRRRLRPAQAPGHCKTRRAFGALPAGTGARDGTLRAHSHRHLQHGPDHGAQPQFLPAHDRRRLRTHILVQLNGHYEGQATGETFNADGKTDILIRQDGRNIFIAECKYWIGVESLRKALDQLLGYAAWRDTRTAIIIFNRNMNTSAVLNQIPATIRSHPNYKRDVPIDPKGSSIRRGHRSEGVIDPKGSIRRGQSYILYTHGFAFPKELARYRRTSAWRWCPSQAQVMTPRPVGKAAPGIPQTNRKTFCQPSRSQSVWFLARSRSQAGAALVK